jgi:type VII secretion integral membrane protein EccD
MAVVSGPVAGLVRVTVAAPRRRVDIALPENVAVAEILPVLLRHGGEELADEGVDHGGWLLRRADGTPLAATKSLSSYRVRDGEILHLVPGWQEWPELDYDDLVDAIASGSRRRNRVWSPPITRYFGLVLGTVVITAALVAVFRSGPHWVVAGRWALGQSAILLVAAVVLARLIGDAVAGTVVGLLALPFAAVGGALLMTKTGDWSGPGANQVEVAGAMLALAALLGYLGVGGDGALFVAGAVSGLLASGGGWLTASEGMPRERVAAILLCAALLLAPAFNAIAIWLARLPIPSLPRSPTDLLRDAPQPSRQSVYAAVARADGLLTGMLIGTSAVAAVGDVMLIRSDGTAARWLVVVAGAAYWLRARPYVIIRQRLPLLGAGLVAGLALLLGPLMSDPDKRLSVAGPLLVGIGAMTVVLGLAYSQRTPGPYLRRYVELIELVLVLAVLPVAAAVLGLYGRLHALG